MSVELEQMLLVIRRLQEQIRDAVVTACERSSMEALASVAADDAGDTIYVIDEVGEDVLLAALEPSARELGGLVLIAEGLTGGSVILGAGREEAARWRVIVDPIDGTRGIMYQKRSAWVLTGVAPNRGPGTNLSDIELAIQTEIPLIKQHLSDSAWAIRGQGAHGERYNRLTGERRPLPLQPARATTIAHGYAMISRFFPGVRDELSAIDEEIVRGALGTPDEGKVACFDDQYASTGGQIFELMVGHDRFTADLRPLMMPLLKKRGLPRSHCCHSYDICTELIAREAGVIITNLRGEPLRDLLRVDADVAWAGYANEQIRAQIEPLLRTALTRRDLI